MIASTAAHPSLPLRVASPFSTPAAATTAVPASPVDAVALSGIAEESTPSLSPSSRMALVGLAALSLFGAVVATTGTAAAAEPQRPALSAVQPAPARRLAARPEVVRVTRQYVEDMVENNHLQGETLNTYGKQFQNNYNTLVRIEQKILANPEALNDPTLRAVYQKIEASLDSIQVFEDKTEDIVYSAGQKQVMELADGTRITTPEPSVKRVPRRLDNDYSGASRMTDATIEKIDALLHPGKVPTR